MRRLPCCLVLALCVIACIPARLVGAPGAPEDPFIAVVSATESVVPPGVRADEPHASALVHRLVVRVITDEPVKLLLLRLRGRCFALTEGPNRAQRRTQHDLPLSRRGEELQVSDDSPEGYSIGSPASCPALRGLSDEDAVLFFSVGRGNTVYGHPFRFASPPPQRP